MPELQIVALFKAGRYTDKGWSLLEHAMAVIADLPSTIHSLHGGELSNLVMLTVHCVHMLALW
jgi:hypothetical protein